MNILTVGTELVSSHNGFTHTATVTRVTKTQAIATTENGVQVRLKIEGSNGTWQAVGSNGHPRDCWKIVDAPVIAAPTMETVETPEAITVTEPIIETTVKAELAAHLSTFIETDKRELAKAADIHPAALSKVLNGSQLSFTTLESLMSVLNLALRPSVFMTVWTARNMETLDTELIIEHYLLRKGDFTPLQRGKLFDFILLPRISDTEITPFDGCRWRVVKLGKRRLAASLDPNGLFCRYVVE